ncbi:MAG TPA: DNA mismatch repair protein MutS, partial [Sphingomonadales bacterium]|nr:DNA mismatch repair protein MutS [Sphingomonadales bacterium]
GFRVAVCEQTEDPEEAKRRGSKSVVRREVIRLVTPGTLTEDNLLDARRHNYLAALGQAGGELSLALSDMSTGDFIVMPVAEDTLDGELTRFNPGEILAGDKFLADDKFAPLLRPWADQVMPIEDYYFDSLEGETLLKEAYGVKTLAGLGRFSRPDLAAAGALLAYIRETQKGLLPKLKTLQKIAPDAAMIIDMATRKNLELTKTLSGETKGSLLSTIDKTVTGAGSRLLSNRLLGPLTDPKEINRRLDSVDFFLANAFLAEKIRKALKSAPDLERALTRLSLGRGGPRDLGAIRDGLFAAREIRGFFQAPKTALEGKTPAEVKGALETLGGHEPLIKTLQKALASDLPVIKRDGGFIAAGFHAALDEFRTLRDESRRLIAALEGRYKKKTGIVSLKIRHNNILGYHIDVTAKNAEKMMQAPLNETFIHRQTLASSVRFSSAELAELAGKISAAADKALNLELQIFEDLTGKVLEAAKEISETAEGLAILDTGSALSVLAAEHNFTRPKMGEGTDFDIKGGWHPVVSEALKKQAGDPFVSNDCDLRAGQRLWLVTGPNMAGKSTFLRQNALIAILAQMGSFVPAKRAEIGIVDRLFSRVGASDDLAQGRSTFMVEMVETASILNQAGEKSLVILDEIGRGTATYDGLSIAWAAVEHLHEVNKSRTLFATHYHELTALHERLENVSLHTMRVKEWQGDLVFLHEVTEGAADRSY